jgi:hypothetical protein
MPGRDVPRAVVDDVELLAALIVTGLKVRVVIDDLDRPLGILELHLLLVIALTGNVLLAFPLAGRCAITAGLLLLLLMELLCKLLDLTALLGTAAHPHRCRRAGAVAYRRVGHIPHQLLRRQWERLPAACCYQTSSSSFSCHCIEQCHLP